jgi:hypothetical protein
VAERTTLAEMVEVLDDEASDWKARLERYAEQHPDEPLPPTHHWMKKARAFKGAADVLRIMGSYEDKSRAFVAQLIKDYSEGRWP